MNRTALLRSTAKNVLAKAGAEIGSRLLGVLFVLLAARALGPEGFGKLTFAAALAALLSAALEFGLRPIVIRQVARAPGTAEHSWRIASGLTLALGGCLLPVLPLIALGLNRPADTVWAVALMGMFGLISAFHELGIAFFTAMRVQEYELWDRLLTKGFLVLLAGLAVWAGGGGLVAITAAYPLSALMSLPLVLWLIRRFSPRLRPLWNRNESLRLWREAWPLAAGTLFHFTSYRFPPLLLALLRPDVEVGYFGAAFRLIEALGFVPAIFVSAVFPILAASYGRDDDRLRAAVQKTFQVLLLLACPLGVGTMFVGGHFLALFYGAAFEPATAILSALIWASAFNFLNFLFFFVFISLDHQEEVTRIAALGLAVNLVLTPPLILRAGGWGAGLGLTAAEATVTLLAALRLRRLLPGLGLWAIAPKIFTASGLMALGLWGARSSPLSVQLVIAGFIYAGSLTLLRTVPRDQLSLYCRALTRREGG